MLEAIRKIIVATDFSELSEAAVRSAGFLAQQDDASVHLLHVIRLPYLHTTYDVNVPEAIWEGIRKGTRERMYESSLFLEEAGVSEVDLIVSESQPPDEAIAKSAVEINADLVVMATHGRSGIKHAFLGSVTERTIRNSPVPVLAIKGAGLTKIPISRILLPTDFSSHTKTATALACSLAERFGAHIDVIHVVNPMPDYLAYGSAEAVAYETQARALVGEQLEATGREVHRSGLSAKTHLCKGITADVIADAARRLNSDLIVMGTHGLAGLAHAVIGSVTERTLRLSPCSVLTTRSGETTSGETN